MVHKFIFFILFLLVAWYQPGFSQDVPLRPLQGYRQHIPQYSQWLQQKQLDSFLSVETDTVKGGYYYLYLDFEVPYDQAGPVWDSLSSRLRRTGGYSLDSLLFFAMLNTFRVPPQKAALLIFDTYDPLKTPRSTAAVYYANDTMTTKLRFSGSKAAKPAEFDVNVDGLLAEGQSLTFSNFGQTRENAYKIILRHLKTYYRGVLDDDFEENFLVMQDAQATALKIRVSGMQREVLYDRSNPWAAQMANWVFGYKLDWTPVEIIQMTIKMEHAGAGEMQLTVDLDGRCGSGMHGGVNWGNGNNMEPAFDTYLTRYALKRANTIKQLFP